MVLGVSEGFAKKLELTGVGYRAALKGTGLDLSLGYSHPVIVDAPEGITFEVPDNTHIVVKGISKEQVGQVAAECPRQASARALQGQGVSTTKASTFVGSSARLVSSLR
jgi:large subunit ribosomal protein L6